MAQLAKYLRFHRDADNIDYTANLYSTEVEAGSTKFPVYVDGIGQAYAAVSGANPLPLKIQDSDGVTYTVHEMSKPPYSTIKYATPGTFTFTVPGGITKLKVTMCAGGGGASIGGGINSTFFSGRAGGNSTISTNICTGGGGGTGVTSPPNDDGDTFSTAVPGVAGTPNGRAGSVSNRGGGSQSIGGAGFTIDGATYGTGGHCFRHTGSLGGGGSGGYISNTLTVTPLETLSVVVGAGGGGCGQIDFNVGYSGTSGVIFLEYGGDI